MFDAILILPGVKGETKDAKYKAGGSAGVDGGIDVKSFSWGMTQPGSSGAAGGGGISKANFQDMSITKAVDSASPVLMKYLAKGTVVSASGGATADRDAAGKLVIRKAGDEEALEYMIIGMESIFITSYATGAGGGDSDLIETISFNFSKVFVDYVEQTSIGGGEATIEFGWNIEENTEA